MRPAQLGKAKKCMIFMAERGGSINIVVTDRLPMTTLLKPADALSEIVDHIVAGDCFAVCARPNESGVKCGRGCTKAYAHHGSHYCPTHHGHTDWE